MCFIRVSASIKTAFAFSLIWREKNMCFIRVSSSIKMKASKYMYFTPVFASVQTAFAFCFGIASECMRFKCVSASIKTAFTFFFYMGPNACVLHGCLHLLRRVRLLRFSSYRVLLFLWHGVKVYVFHMRLCIGSDSFCVFFVSRYNAGVSHACLPRLRRLRRFPWYGEIMHTFHTRVCLG